MSKTNMENIYKIRIKSNPPTSGLYPSERRYSASTVLGLAVVHLALAFTAILLASLSITREKDLLNASENNTNVISVSTSESTLDSTTDLPQSSTTDATPLDDGVYGNLSVGPCVMSFGALLAGTFGLLAWKRWYIDNNIKWFFLCSIVSCITSAVCVLSTAITVSIVGELPRLNFSADLEDANGLKPSFSLVIAVNVLIASFSELVWSLLSARVAYKGMMNKYTDEMEGQRSRGRVEVNTVTKGNGKRGGIPPPDILNHFPNSGKFAKFLPKRDSKGYLPKQESHSEYKERVEGFLREQRDSNCVKSVEE